MTSDSVPSAGLTRREFLRVGVIGATGVTLSDCLRLRAAMPMPVPDRAQTTDAVIQIVLDGGMSHLDSFDPKPSAPLDVRGAFGAISTRVGGLQLSALWGQTASVSDKLVFIRSLTHDQKAHDRGLHQMLTGHCPLDGFVYPSMGSVVAHEFEPRSQVPSYFALPNPACGYGFGGPGYLGPSYGGFAVEGDPAAEGFVVRDLVLPPGLEETRASQSKDPLAAVDEHFRRSERNRRPDGLDAFGQRAYSLITSQDAREAFDLKAEPEQVRMQYGRGQAGPWLLIARRLVEAGARFVTVFSGGWDMHVDLHAQMRSLVPPLDQAIAALIRDLSERGMLDTTMVMITTEFGRDPRLNKDRGRDHWSKVFSIAMAGGGIRGGQVIGSSSPDGSEPKDNPVRPADVAATVFTRLGIDPAKKLKLSAEHPTDIVQDGSPIKQLV